jgi:hypothetical protein
MYIAQATNGVFRIVRNLEMIDPKEHAEAAQLAAV